jgi:drug/metabolite transporter (DMT)-like permease
MTAKAVVEIVFGICFVLLPIKLGSIFGMELSPSGVLMAQLFGTAFIFGSIVLWLARNAPSSEIAIRAIITSVVVSNVIGFIVTLLASLSHVWNALGWLPVLLYLVFALGFAYFLFVKKPV